MGSPFIVVLQFYILGSPSCLVIGIPNVPQTPPNPYILITLQKVNKLLMSKYPSLWKTFKIQTIAGDCRYNILHILHYRRKMWFPSSSPEEKLHWKIKVFSPPSLLPTHFFGNEGVISLFVQLD